MKKILSLFLILFCFSCEKPKYDDHCYSCSLHKWGYAVDSTYVLCDVSNEYISKHLWSVSKDVGYIKCERVLLEPYQK